VYFVIAYILAQQQKRTYPFPRRQAPSAPQPVLIRNLGVFLNGAQAGGRTWDLLVFVYFLSLKQRLRPLCYCAPSRKEI